jgi:hypothetical protein
VSKPGGPPKKDPPPEPVPEAPADDREIGSVDELYGSAPNPFPSQSVYAEDPDVYGDEPRSQQPAAYSGPMRAPDYSSDAPTSAEPVPMTESAPQPMTEAAAMPDVPATVEPTSEPPTSSIETPPVWPTNEPAHLPPGYEPIPTSNEPMTSAAADLRDAVGAPTPKRRTAKFDVLDGEPKSRRMVMLLGAGVLALITIAVLVILGSVNSRRYEITCSSDHVGAEQGRGFPPWGTQQMRGAEWKPIALPPNAECKPRETEDKAELEGWYLEALLERASTTLTTPHLVEQIPVPPPDKKPPPNILDLVSEQLQQALLLSRAPERRDQRKEVERLMGDVQYWRASLRLRDAQSALLDASKQFDQASQQRPRHVTDASAWSQFVKKLADDLRAGPNGVPAAAQNFPPAPTTSDRPSAPAGTALPVETPPPQIDETPPPAPDAGVPTGGVLL